MTFLSSLKLVPCLYEKCQSHRNTKSLPNCKIQSIYDHPQNPHISQFDDVMTLSDADGHGLVHERELMKDINFFMKLS
jgi:hypothetical protein